MFTHIFRFITQNKSYQVRKVSPNETEEKMTLEYYVDLPHSLLRLFRLLADLWKAQHCLSSRERNAQAISTFSSFLDLSILRNHNSSHLAGIELPDTGHTVRHHRSLLHTTIQKLHEIFHSFRGNVLSWVLRVEGQVEKVVALFVVHVVHRCHVELVTWNRRKNNCDKLKWTKIRGVTILGDWTELTDQIYFQTGLRKQKRKNHSWSIIKHRENGWKLALILMGIT